MSDENRYGNVAGTFCALLSVCLSVCDDEFRFAVPSEVPFAMRREFLVRYEIFQDLTLPPSILPVSSKFLLLRSDTNTR